jgi:esterase/lipase superfamily enzyme
LTAGLILYLFLGLNACSSKKIDQLNLMPAPDVFDEGVIDPFTDTNPIENIPYSGMLYATDREPDRQADRLTYLSKRGGVVRLGVAQTEVGDTDITWEEARRISLLKNRTTQYPLKVTAVEEFGILDRSISVFTDPEMITGDRRQPAQHFADQINAKLARSKRRDIYVYVHGYKVVFENPILVASELWHFLGYDGVFIAYSWPSTPKTLAYASDLETAVVSSQLLRVFLEYLAAETPAERIHIVGYSAGTRVVLNALWQLALLHKNKTKEQLHKELRIGSVILVGSDFDRYLFGSLVVDGLLKIPKTLTIYQSRTDKALGFSSWLFGRNRLGQTTEDRQVSPVVASFLKSQNDLILIDVTGAAAAATDNGHAYFRKSPWVSSDILVNLLHDVPPVDRGLVQDANSPIWYFPENYIERLRAVLEQTHAAK